MIPRRPAQLHVTIDRLVLAGVPADQRAAVATALVAELRRQLVAAHAAGTLGDSRTLAGTRQAMPRQAATGDSHQLGALAAAGVMRSLRP
jgi:hypothetical protein